MTNLVFRTTIGEVTLGDYPWIDDLAITLLPGVQQAKCRQIGSVMYKKVTLIPIRETKFIEIDIRPNQVYCLIPTCPGYGSYDGYCLDHKHLAVNEKSSD